MEKKKLLLVAVSVGVFLIIVIGLSILIFLPKNKETTPNSRIVSKAAAKNSPSSNSESGSKNSEVIPFSGPERKEPATVDAVDMLRNREDLQVLQPPPPSLTESSKNNGSNLVIEVPSPSSTTALKPADQVRVTQTPPSVPQQATPVSSTVNTPPRAVKPPEVPKPVATPAAVRPPAAKSYEDYWVQAGSFSTLVRAEDVKNTLADKGITARIENKDVNGKNVFRVRIGPYTSQNEANYWLALIKTINGFENSQIWQSKSER